MDVSDWDRFVKRGQREVKYVAHLPAYLNGLMLASSHQIHIAHEYAVKAIIKHGLSIEHLPLISETLRNGEAIYDRPKHLTFFYLSPEFDRWFQVTIKCCSERRQLFVTTFHGMSPSDITRKRKKFQQVWPLT